MRLIFSLAITFLFPNIAHGNELSDVEEAPSAEAASNDSKKCEPNLQTAVGIVTTIESGEEKPKMISSISQIRGYELDKGAPVLWNSQIVTDAKSRVFITLTDGSTLLVGPNSDVTMNSFIYDPCAIKNNPSAILKGLARAVSGKINSLKKQKESTPEASYAGIRG